MGIAVYKISNSVCVCNKNSLQCDKSENNLPISQCLILRESETVSLSLLSFKATHISHHQFPNKSCLANCVVTCHLPFVHSLSMSYSMKSQEICHAADTKKIGTDLLGAKRVSLVPFVFSFFFSCMQRISMTVL